jgi:sigma-E factor negative regulatory protein RseB
MLLSLLPRGLRVAPWMLLAGALLLANVASAQPASDPQNEVREAREWLSRIHEATASRNFVGTFVVSAGGMMFSSRIAHFCDGTNQFERIESLDGQMRQVYRRNEAVTSLWPRVKVAVLETRQLTTRFPALLPAGADRIVESYRVRPLGEGRVAGHEAHVLLLSPRDGFRFGYRLWADKDSGLLLRAEVFNDRDVVLESSAFSDLIIGAKPQPELVTRAMKKLDGYRIVRPVLEPVELQAEGWSLRDAPPGFDHVSSVRRSMAANDAADTPGPGAPVLQSIYSDGLTYVSVFIEPFVPDLHKRESLMMFGATQTLVRRDGDWWVTVIGDVPVVTLRAFASGLKRR